MFRAVMLSSLMLFVCPTLFAENLVFADFESKDYGNWTATGEAFGPGPARGTLDGQMDVSGFKGRRLVNSFHKGDGTTGTLTSPAFTIAQPCISFLIGGGKFPGETCMNLLVDGAIVRTATGPNEVPGGSERLHWESWDVNDLAGKQATLQIVDNRTDYWGHINVDQIVFCDAPLTSERKLETRIEKPVLNVPIKNGAPKVVFRLLRGSDILREYDVELTAGEPDFWAPVDVAPFQGEPLALWVEDPDGDALLANIQQADTLLGGENLYKETYRPLAHFSPKRGWNNDPNGLVYYQGEYHLFFQHNPVGWSWGNMTWGHAVSADLVHWNELGDAIHPDALGTIFSGSAVVDTANTTGFKTGDEAPIVCIYTAAGGTSRWSENQKFTQCLAYSNDRGRTWTNYVANPVLQHINGGNRDPKAFWYAPGNCWVIVLYLDDKRMGLFNSPDLKTWTQTSELTCFHECPELFPLQLDGTCVEKWILYGANGDYYVGAFDGKTFTPETEALPYHHGNCFYASQTYNNLPSDDKRRIQIAWGTIGDKRMPFNQQMDFPVELTLQSTQDGPRLAVQPVKEIERLYRLEQRWNQSPLQVPIENTNFFDVCDLYAEIQLNSATQITFTLRGKDIVYDAATQQLTCADKTAPVKLNGGLLTLRILLDKQSLEIFTQNGLVYMPMGFRFDDDRHEFKLTANSGDAIVKTMEAHELQSSWGG